MSSDEQRGALNNINQLEKRPQFSVVALLSALTEYRMYICIIFLVSTKIKLKWHWHTVLYSILQQTNAKLVDIVS